MRRTLTVMAGLLCLVSWCWAGNILATKREAQESVSLSSALVLLNVTVTSRGQQYVGGLQEKDFQVIEDGRPQKIAYFGQEETPFAAAILLDVSGSMERMVRIARAAARQFADKLRDEDVFALYVFADEVAQVQDFGPGPDVDEVIWSLRPEGNTALYDSVYRAAQDLGRRPERRRAILVLSDGADTRSHQSLDACIRAALSASVTIHTVNLMDQAHAWQPEAATAAGALRMMAEITGGRYIDDPGGARMYQAFDELVEELSHQYTIGYFPTPEKRDGRWHTIRVEVLKPGVQVRTRQGYHAPKGK